MGKILTFILLLLVVSISIYTPNLIRVYKLSNLYNEKTIAHNFINMDKVFIASEPIEPSDNPYIFEKDDFELPEKYSFEGSEHDLLEGLAHFKTDGLIILHDNKMLYEEYWNSNDKNSKHISWSVAKSFLSALMGIALDEGLIDSIDDPATNFNI